MLRALRLPLAASVAALAVGAAVWYALTVLPRSGEEIAALDHPGAGEAAKELDLDPAMNPLRVTLAVTRSYAMAGNRLSARVALRSPEGDTLWTERLRLADPRESGPGASHATRPVAVFTVPRAGRYRLVAALDGGGVRDARFAVRRNVQAVRAPWLDGLLASAGLDVPGVFAPAAAATSR